MLHGRTTSCPGSDSDSRPQAPAFDHFGPAPRLTRLGCPREPGSRPLAQAGPGPLTTFGPGPAPRTGRGPTPCHVPLYGPARRRTRHGAPPYHVPVTTRAVTQWDAESWPPRAGSGAGPRPGATSGSRPRHGPRRDPRGTLNLGPLGPAPAPDPDSEPSPHHVPVTALAVTQWDAELRPPRAGTLCRARRACDSPAGTIAPRRTTRPIVDVPILAPDFKQMGTGVPRPSSLHGLAPTPTPSAAPSPLLGPATQPTPSATRQRVSYTTPACTSPDGARCLYNQCHY